ncbi:MAG: O-antigen ligase family protein, partial [Rhizobiales bacterium]|nr:O-antigen ligase family protein [Hyphomicrobiales bacterium]
PIVLVISILSLSLRRIEFILSSIVITMTLDIKGLIYISFIYFIYIYAYIIYRSFFRRVSAIELTYIIFSLIGFVIALSVGGNFNYNLVKFFSLYMPIGLLLILRRSEVGSLRRDNIYTIYIISVFTSIVCKALYFPAERDSIFNGTENIGFFIITILMIASLSQVKRIHSKLFVYVLYITYVISTNSRTAFAFSLILVGFSLFGRISKFAIFLMLASLLIIMPIVSDEIEVLSLIRKQMEIFLDNLGHDGILYSLSLIDVRGVLYREAIDLIFKSPLFGNGSVPPSIYDEDIYGIPAFHNSVLDLLVTFGIFGFLSYVVVFFSVTGKFLKKDGGSYALMISAFLLLGFFQPILFNTQAMLIFFLLVALLEAGESDSGKADVPVKNVA